jgi:hypothetical protein
MHGIEPSAQQLPVGRERGAEKDASDRRVVIARRSMIVVGQ